MKQFVKHIAAILERVPLMTRSVAGALAGYRLYQKQKQFRSSLLEIGLLLKTVWMAGQNSVRVDCRVPLIMRKAIAFQRILAFMLNEVESKGIGILLGKEIPNWYPRFMSLREEREYREVGNLTPGYYNVLKLGLCGIYDRIKRHENSSTKEAFVITIKAIREFLDRLKSILVSKEFVSIDGVTARDLAQWINHAPYHPPETFEEALFTVWFLNLLCWWDNHHLIGLGRLDQWLYPYLKHDLEKGKITEENAYERVKQFIQWLNNGRFRKSNVLLGDTGQTLVIGGIDSHGRDATNLLSLFFVKAAEELRLPEPKLVVRLHKRSPEEFMCAVSHLVSLNLGYPLICNDEVVIPALIKAGYSEEDARDYVVAACWEYLIPGRSFDQGNMGIVSFPIAVLKALNDASGRGTQTFDEFMEIFGDQLQRIIEERVQDANSIRWVPAPYLSIMMKRCIETCKDISEGGCKYNNYGLLGSGLADGVDSLIAIKKTVFDEKTFTLKSLQRILQNNYRNNEITRRYFQHRLPKFGNDDDFVDSIAVNIVETYAQLMARYRTRFGGIFRPGLGSAGQYIYEAQTIGATPNGRKAGEPYAVDWSPSLSAPRLGPTAILRSVTKPDLSLMSNCAIVELYMDTSFLWHSSNDHLWIKWLIEGFLELCGAELQLNLIDANLLREAQQYPDKYTNLLVRVWGFSAYFVELPKEFQDHIIARVESCRT